MYSLFLVSRVVNRQIYQILLLKFLMVNVIIIIVIIISRYITLLRLDKNCSLFSKILLILNFVLIHYLQLMKDIRSTVLVSQEFWGISLVTIIKIKFQKFFTTSDPNYQVQILWVRNPPTPPSQGTPVLELWFDPLYTSGTEMFFLQPHRRINI